MTVSSRSLCRQLCLGSALLLAGCGGPVRGAPASGASAAPSASSKPAGCLSQQQAEAVWKQVDDALIAVQLDPKHAGLDRVATGQALLQFRDYLRSKLESKGFTERELDRLKSLTVIRAGCDGSELAVRVTVTLVADDYLRADGSVDHRDPAVGTDVTTLETFVRAGGTWKESSIADPNAPSPSPNII